MTRKISVKKWIVIFISSIIIGLILYPIAVKIIFKPEISELYNVCVSILSNLGTPYLKMKAYVAFIVLIAPFILVTLWWFMQKNVELEQYGNAAFAKEEDFGKMGVCEDKGLMLGCLIKKDFNGNEQRKMIRAKSPLACLVVAPPGTGKTASIALPNLYSLPNSCFVLDIKGELYQKSAGYRQKHFNNEILLFSPFSDENTMFFNPFDNSVIKNMNFVQMMKLAEQIAGTIFVAEKGKEGDHWVVSAKTMFTYFALYNMQKHKHTTLADLAQAPKKDYYDELEDEYLRLCQKEDEDEGEYVRDIAADTLKAFFQQVSNDEDVDEIVRNQFRAWTTAAEQEFASIKSTYDTYMKVFANPQVAKSVSKMNFDYEDLREKKITMYVVIQTEDMDILAPLVRILVESLFKYLMGKENSNPDKFIYFLLDEFVRFGKMPFLLEAPALCRSYGLIPVYITQSYEQIKKYYGDEDVKIIRANVGYQVVFRMNSTEDAKVLSEMIGNMTRQKTQQSKGNLDFFKRNDSVSNEGYKLVTEQDIISNPADQIYILIGGFFNRPIKAKVNMWFKNPEWQGADKIPLIVNLSDEEKPNDENQAQETTNTEEEPKKADENKNDESAENFAYPKREPMFRITEFPRRAKT